MMKELKKKKKCHVVHDTCARRWRMRTILRTTNSLWPFTLTMLRSAFLSLPCKRETFCSQNPKTKFHGNGASYGWRTVQRNTHSYSDVQWSYGRHFSKYLWTAERKQSVWRKPLNILKNMQILLRKSPSGLICYLNYTVYLVPVTSVQQSFWHRRRSSSVRVFTMIIVCYYCKSFSFMLNVSGLYCWVCDVQKIARLPSCFMCEFPHRGSSWRLFASSLIVKLAAGTLHTRSLNSVLSSLPSHCHLSLSRFELLNVPAACAPCTSVPHSFVCDCML